MNRPTATHWTYEDLLRMPEEDGMRYEIIEGERFMTPSPFADHQRASRNLEFLLVAFVEERDLGEVFDAPFDVILKDDTVLIPDLVFVSKARASIIEQPEHTSGEVASPVVLPGFSAPLDRIFAPPASRA